MKPLSVLGLVAFLWTAPLYADYALIDRGAVAQVEVRPFPVANPLMWVKTPDGVSITPGWRYNGGFIPPAPLPAPPTESEKFSAAVAADPKFRALVRALAEDKGKTEQQIIDWLKSKL